MAVARGAAARTDGEVPPARGAVPAARGAVEAAAVGHLIPPMVAASGGTADLVPQTGQIAAGAGRRAKPTVRRFPTT